MQKKQFLGRGPGFRAARVLLTTPRLWEQAIASFWAELNLSLGLLQALHGARNAI